VEGNVHEKDNLLKMKTRLQPGSLTGWKTAKKTKPLKAKHMSAIMTDKSVAARFLLATLEGNQVLANDSFVCVGADDDAWQQTSAALFKKYNMSAADPDGWITCTPKPEVAAEAIEVLVTMTTDSPDFEIVGQWGQKNEAGELIQNGVVGDYLCRRPSDNSDVWVVARRVFLNTYEFVEPAENVIKLNEEKAS
jgi:hypothetical protein